MIHAKFQQNIPSRSGEKSDFINFVIFSTGGLLALSARLNFHIPKPCSLIMRHVKSEIHGFSGLRGYII